MRQHSYAIEEIRKFFIDTEVKKRNFNLKIESNEIEDNKLSTIKISDLNFSYKNNGKIFDMFNLQVSVGQIIAIQGPSGSGKTTLIDLILKIT